jgi:hypothetical protein
MGPAERACKDLGNKILDLYAAEGGNSSAADFWDWGNAKAEADTAFAVLWVKFNELCNKAKQERAESS